MLQDDMKNKEYRWHPTQKPIQVMKWCLNKYCNKGQVVFDPFLGSGTTALACKELEIKYIGTEISKDYFEIAQKRLDNVPQSLF